MENLTSLLKKGAFFYAFLKQDRQYIINVKKYIVTGVAPNGKKGVLQHINRLITRCLSWMFHSPSSYIQSVVCIYIYTFKNSTEFTPEI